MSEAPFLGKFECTSCKCCTVEITEHRFLPGFFCVYYKCGPVGGCCPTALDCKTTETGADGEVTTTTSLLMEGCHPIAVEDRDTLVDCCCFKETRVATSTSRITPAAQQMER